ncbi:MAG TPA: AMP-binding protein [Melioribacteraceae bacterium]|nr:AMP-binding protein [Melioribacteraceae bacterium]
MYKQETDWLKKWAVYNPDKMFLREHEKNTQWDYYTFNQKSNFLANKLVSKYKLVKGDRICVYSKNSAEYVLLFTACIKTGIILVPLNFRLTARELDILIADAEPKLFLYEKEYSLEIQKLNSLNKIKLIESTNIVSEILYSEIELLENYSADIDFEDPVMILYTAGTTGLSKGAIINHRMLFWNAVNTGLRLDLNSTDHTQSYAPFFHTGGWNVLFTPFLFHGASHTLLQKFDADLILQLMEKEKTTILFGVPTMLQMMSDSPLFNTVDLSKVRYAIVGGAPMPIPLINVWHNKGIYIRQGYGLTEVGPNCYSLHQKDAIRKKGSIGFPNFFLDVKLVKEDGSECGNNEIGELWIKSPIVTPGYWRKEEETKKSITEGYFHTGDMMLRDDEGYYYVVDRKKNMFISGGENVYPAEIEAFIITNPSVKEVAVIGVNDEKWGEVGKAFVVINKGSNIKENDLSEFCKGKLAKYKIPKYFVILDEIPKNEAGKIDRKKLINLNNTH